MRDAFWKVLSLGPILGPALAIPFSSFNHLITRQEDDSDDVFDPQDLSWITKMAAIGDSYSAGIGAGDRLGTLLGLPDSQSCMSCPFPSNG